LFSDCQIDFCFPIVRVIFVFRLSDRFLFSDCQNGFQVQQELQSHQY